MQSMVLDLQPNTVTVREFLFRSDFVELDLVKVGLKRRAPNPMFGLPDLPGDLLVVGDVLKVAATALGEMLTLGCASCWGGGEDLDELSSKSPLFFFDNFDTNLVFEGCFRNEDIPAVGTGDSFTKATHALNLNNKFLANSWLDAPCRFAVLLHRSTDE